MKTPLTTASDTCIDLHVFASTDSKTDDGDERDDDGCLSVYVYAQRA